MKVFAGILVLLGLLVSVYLTIRHVELAMESDQVGQDVCSAIFSTSCDETLRSPFAKQLGLPLGGWGIVYYGTLASLLFMGWILGKPFQMELMLAGIGLALVGAIVSLLLFSTMVSGIVPFCPLCLTVQIINVLLVHPLKRMTPHTWGEVFRGFSSGLRFVVTGKSSDPLNARWTVLGLSTSGLIGVVLFQWVFIQVELRTQPGGSTVNLHELLTDFEASPQHEIPRSPDDPSLGANDATVELVVFSDFHCPACRQFAKGVTRLLDEFEDKIQIIFKHYPLDTACNGSINYSLHPQACEAAWAAEAARRQGRFWAFHDALVATDLRHHKNEFIPIIEHLEMDPNQFEADLKLQAVKDKIKADIALGEQLKVNATPTIFLNGKRVHDTRIDSLMSLIAYVLTSH